MEESLYACAHRIFVSFLLMKFIWGVRDRLDAVMFCSDFAVCSYV